MSHKIIGIRWQVGIHPPAVGLFSIAPLPIERINQVQQTDNYPAGQSGMILIGLAVIVPIRSYQPEGVVGVAKPGELDESTDS
jgi:hypothetical protein